MIAAAASADAAAAAASVSNNNNNINNPFDPVRRASSGILHDNYNNYKRMSRSLDYGSFLHRQERPNGRTAVVASAADNNTNVVGVHRMIDSIHSSVISHSGYLLKRSNNPIHEVSLPFDANESLALPNPNSTANVGDAAADDDDNCDTNFGLDDADAFLLVGTSDVDSEEILNGSQQQIEHQAWNSFEATDRHNKTSMTLSTLNTNHVVDVEEREQCNEDKTTDDELGLEFFSSLIFGIDIPKFCDNQLSQNILNNNHVVKQKSLPLQQLSQDKTTTATPIKGSIPIKVRRSDHILPSSLQQHDDPQSLSPLTLCQPDTNSSPQPSNSDPDHTPNDYIDPTDGHIWRANYCVLEYGTLFFYRNQRIGESAEAVRERLQHYYTAMNASMEGSPTTTTTTTTTILAMSPNPKSCLRQIQANNNEDDKIVVSETIYDKCIALEQVGAVRSAEVEHGPHSFELTAGDDSRDKLVLRARNDDERNEWLFQFHRCIASFVLDMMDHVKGLTPSRVWRRGIHQRSTFPTNISSDCEDGEEPVSPYSTGTSSPPPPLPSRQTMSLTGSPRYHRILTSTSFTSSRLSLSHGHGRNLLQRRREESRLGPTTRQISSHDPFPTLPFPRSDPPKTMHSPLPHKPLLGDLPVSVLTPHISSQQTECPIIDQLNDSNSNLRHPHRESTSPNSPVIASNGKKYIPPHQRKQFKYIPPHLRNKNDINNITTPTTLNSTTTYDQYILRNVQNDTMNGLSVVGNSISQTGDNVNLSEGMDSNVTTRERLIKLGGCADPAFVSGSIFDERFVPIKASRLDKIQTTPFGYSSSTACDPHQQLQWEIGAFSECGIRETNEDSFLVTSNLVKAFATLQAGPIAATVWDTCNAYCHPPGLFAIFDGHCGDQAARFAAERLISFVYEESLSSTTLPSNGGEVECDIKHFVEVLDRVIHRLDDEFCNLCVNGKRQWISGSTALIVALVNEHLIVASLGDARGIVGRSVSTDEDMARHKGNGWNELPLDESSKDTTRCLWKEVADVHCPSRPDERERIQLAGGWVTTEQEIPVVRIKRLALYDDDVVDILQRCFADRYQPFAKASAPDRMLQISRVCGDLAVTRALGDRDYKASHNTVTSTIARNGRTSRVEAATMQWDNDLFAFPEGHKQYFVGDLVTNKPDFQALRVGEMGVSQEFLLLACDGLWDVIDPDDACRVTRDLLFEKGWSAKKTAGRLAELAVHLGSSDNITVVVVRFCDRKTATAKTIVN